MPAWVEEQLTQLCSSSNIKDLYHSLAQSGLLDFAGEVSLAS